MKLLVAALVSTSAALAQVQAGRIVGTVFDPQRAAVPGAIVNVTEISTNHTNSATTNQVGDFVITPLNPGLYNIVVTMFGFQTVEVNRVEVVVGQSARVDVELRIGEAATKVEVTTVVPLLNT